MAVSSSVRRTLRVLHRWLGLSLGLLFAVLALSGSALVFYTEIDAALHPEVQPDPSLPPLAWDSHSWDVLQTTALRHRPEPNGEWAFEVTGQGGPIPARYYPPTDHSGHAAEREMLWFSADGSGILRSATWGEYLMSWLYELHMHLLAGETGRQVVGWAGFASLLLLLGGLALWWPRGSWRKALAFKRRAAPIRRMRDLHKLAGLGSVFLLILLVLSGALLALPDIKDALLRSAIAIPTAPPAVRSGAAIAAMGQSPAVGQSLPLSQALAHAREALPDARLAFVNLPVGGDAPIRVRVQVPGDPHRRFPSSYVYIDQYSGELLAVHDLRQGNAANVLNSWIRPLHDGSIAGTMGRVLALLLGFVPPFLFVSGLLYWRTRRRSLAARSSS